MKSAVESVSPTRAKLTVEVPFEELKPSVDAAYKKIAQQINVPGFRKGKVPPPVIDRQVGRGVVLDQAINDVVPQLYFQAVQENSLKPLAAPEIEVTSFADQESLEFTAEVDVRPEIPLPDYHGLQAQVDAAEVTDADVEEQLEVLRQRFGTLVDVDRPAADGDFVVIDLAAFEDGEPVAGAELSGVSYQVGRGDMLDGLDEALVGMSAGDERTFSSTLVGGELAGKQVEVRTAVAQVQEQQLPEVDDEFAQLASEFDTVSELVADLRERLGRGRRLQQAAEARDAVLEALLEQVEMPLPERVLTDELNHRREGFEREIASLGLSLADYLESEQTTLEEHEADLERRTRDAVTAQLLLDDIAQAEQIGVDQSELSQHLVRRAQASGQDPQEFANHMFEHNHIPELVQEIRRGKALARIVEAAVVTDSAGNVLDLKNLRPDGTLGEPAPEEPEPAESEIDEPTSAEHESQEPASEEPAPGERSGTR